MGYSGIILAGGQSSRMGTDKSMLPWNGKPLYKHIKDLITPYCDNIFISCNSNNIHSFENENCILDLPKFAGHGPISGLLSCMENTKGPWLLMAVDFALIEADEVRILCDMHDMESIATVYANKQNNTTEPLFGIYGIESQILLTNWYNSSQYSLRSFLDNTKVQKLPMTDSKKFQSLNDKDIYHKLINKF